MANLQSENPFLNLPPALDPFRSEIRSNHVARPDDEMGYALVKSAPEVSASECELPGTTSVEVMVFWGTTVLHVAHLTPPRAFFLGESSPQSPCDFELPGDKIGGSRIPLIALLDAVPHAIVPPGARAQIESGGVERPVDDETSLPFPELPGARAVELARATRITITAQDLVFKLASVDAGKPTARRVFAEDRSAGLYFGLALATHAVLLGALAFFAPKLGLGEDAELEAEREYVAKQYLAAAAEREMQIPERPKDPTDQQGSGDAAASAQVSEGKAGKPRSAATNRRMALRGPSDNKQPELPRELVLREAERFGIIGGLSDLNGDPKTQRVPWSRDAVLGSDAVSAIGNIWGDELGEAVGAGGLRLSGYEEGGGGRGPTIGVGIVGTCGTVSCGGLGGSSTGLGTIGTIGTHQTRVPNPRGGPTELSGRLPPEVVQRIVRQNYGRFRMCYEQGLARQPNLEGRVSARFVIGRDGGVSNVTNGGSDLPDSAVVSCVIGAFYGLSFPAPDGGVVTVSYPIMFSPGA